MAKHTPRPWVVNVGETETSVESTYTTVASNVSNDDAALIAAAPDMLAALELVAERNGFYEMKRKGTLSEGAKAVVAAIAKAKGEIE